jgi:hypothetical protein
MGDVEPAKPLSLPATASLIRVLAFVAPVPPSKSQKGAVFEWGISNLTLFLSGGDLRVIRPLPDDQDVDRILTRLKGRRALFLQLKTRASMRRRDTLELSFPPMADAASRKDLYLLSAELIPRSPWVGSRFAFIPAAALPRPSPRGDTKLFIPLSPGSKSKWAPFVHDTAELATVLSKVLDKGPEYPFPPPGGPSALVRKLSNRAQGHLIETEIAGHLTWFSEGRLHVWSPLVDDFGEDFVVEDRDREAVVRIQPKGTVGLDRGGVIHLRVHESTFRPRDFDFLVFANFDPAAVAMTPWAFVVRADEFAKHARSYEGYLHFVGRPSPAYKGVWKPWLYRIEEVAGVIETALAVRRARGPGAKLPASRVEVSTARVEMTRARRGG